MHDVFAATHKLPVMKPCVTLVVAAGWVVIVITGVFADTVTVAGLERTDVAPQVAPTSQK